MSIAIYACADEMKNALNLMQFLHIHKKDRYFRQFIRMI